MQIILQQSGLVRSGTAVLWRAGRVIWAGSIGEPIEDMDFDAVTVSPEDFKWFKSQLARRDLSKSLK